MFIEMECARCAVASTCPRRGSSPLLYGKHSIKCRIIGGFGKIPLDKSILSSESLKKTKKDGECLTVAEVPAIEDEIVIYNVTKIFSPPVLSDREKNVATTSSNVEVRSYKADKR